MSKCFDCANGYEGMHLYIDNMTDYQIRQYEEEQERKREEAKRAIKTIRGTVIFGVVGPGYIEAYLKLNELKNLYINPNVRLIQVIRMEGVE